MQAVTKLGVKCGNLTPAGESVFTAYASWWWAKRTRAVAFCQYIERQFGHRVVTDGYSASIILLKSATNAHHPPPPPQPRRLTKCKRDPPPAAWVRGLSPPDFQHAVQSGCHIVGVDPGRRPLVTAVTYNSDAQYRDATPNPPYCVSSWIKARWYEVSGINHHALKTSQWFTREPQVHQDLLATPTPKVASLAAFGAHIRHRLHVAPDTETFSQP